MRGVEDILEEEKRKIKIKKDSEYGSEYKYESFGDSGDDNDFNVNKFNLTSQCIITECESIIDKDINTFKPNFQTHIKDFTKQYFCLYVIKDSKITNQLYFKFTCKFSGTTKSCSTACQSYIYFKRKENKISFSCANWQHNHSLEQMFINSKVNLLTSSLKEEISNMRSEGQSAGFVRRRLDLEVLPKFLYESSRTAIRERYQHQVQNLIQNSESKYIKLFFIQHFWDEQTYLGSTFISRRFVGMPFAEDILLVDDTSCTNKFNYPIIIAIGLDENRISQLIVF